MARSKTSTYLPVGAAVAAGLLLYWYATKAKAQPRLPPTPAPPPTVPRPSVPPRKHPPPYGKLCNPPEYGGQSRYDLSYWEEGGTEAARERIFEAFEVLGYQTPDDRTSMNDPGAPGDPLGPAGEVPDLPSEEVRQFQKDYNRASKAAFLPKSETGAEMGTLDEDGFVGPCTLNGLYHVITNLGEQEWPD